MTSERFLALLTVTSLALIGLMAINMYFRIVSRLNRVNEEQDKIIGAKHAMSPAEIRHRMDEGDKHFKRAWDLLNEIISGHVEDG